MDVFDLLDDHKEVREYFYQTVRPLVRTLMRYGFPVDTAVDLLRLAYLHDYSEMPGERKSLSECMSKTGLTRTQIKRLESHDHPVDFRRNHRRDFAARVLHTWESSLDFHSDDKPGWLPVASEDGRSFRHLVRRCGSYVAYHQVLSDLLAAGSVDIEDGGVRLVNPTYGASGMEVYKLEIAGIMANRHGRTVDWNARSTSASDRHLHRIWRRARIPREKEGEVRRALSRLGEQAGRDMDSYLDDVAHEVTRPGQEYVEMGVVIFTYGAHEPPR